MADHLQLPGLTPLPTKRINVQFDPEGSPRDRGEHATTLRGLIEGLESAGALPAVIDADGEIDPKAMWDQGELVIKFVGGQPFDNAAFKSLGLMPLAVTDDKRYFALTDADARIALARLVGRYIDLNDDLETVAKGLQKELAKVEGIELYGPGDRLAPDVKAPVGDALIEIDVAVWPTSLELQSDDRRGQERVRRLVEFIEAESQRDPRVRVLAADDRDPDRLLVHARVDARALEALAKHHLVEKIRGPLRVPVTRQDLQATILPRDALLPEGEPIGLIDDLVVEAHPWLLGAVVEQRSFPDEQSLGDSTRHGTQVASVAAWGDVRALLDPAFDGQPQPLYVARVAQSNDNFDAQVYGNASEQFSAALDWLASKGVRIVVLALGESYADNGPLTSDLSATVDEKAREHGMVVVTSAGNFRTSDAEELATYPSFLQTVTSGPMLSRWLDPAITLRSRGRAPCAQPRPPGVRSLSWPLTAETGPSTKPPVMSSTMRQSLQLRHSYRLPTDACSDPRPAPAWPLLASRMRSQRSPPVTPKQAPTCCAR